MTRSIWKNNFLDSSFFRYYYRKRPKTARKSAILKVWSRRSTIPNFLTGLTVQVYTGKTFRRLFITREKVGFKFGAFIKTRTKISIRKLKKKKKKKIF